MERIDRNTNIKDLVLSHCPRLWIEQPMIFKCMLDKKEYLSTYEELFSNVDTTVDNNENKIDIRVLIINFEENHLYRIAFNYGTNGDTPEANDCRYIIDQSEVPYFLDNLIEYQIQTMP
jgi:hypothetical protein